MEINGTKETEKKEMMRIKEVRSKRNELWEKTVSFKMYTRL